MDLAMLYSEVHILLEKKCATDSLAEPYKSKYIAREKLEEIKHTLYSELDMQTPTLTNKQVALKKAQLAAVILQLGIIGLETEELSTGQEHLEKVLELVSKSVMSPLCVSLTVLCYNNLAVLWSHRDEQEKAQRYLVESRALYVRYRNQDEAEPPLAVHELFLSDPSIPGGWKVLEKLHTLNLYYLAQVTGKLGNADESAHLCLTTLHRQLSSGEYQMLSWAINAATLAKFYQIQQKYRLARRLLAAAWTMLENPILPVDEERQTSVNSDEREKLLESKAEVARRWGLYCVCLLQDSYGVRLMMPIDAEISGERTENDSQQRNDPGISEESCLEQIEFCKLELSALEEKTDCRHAKTYDEAKKIFSSGLKWLTEAQNFYTLEDHASTHAEVAQTMSTLYKILALFDSEPDRRSKMHKRRVDLLTPVNQELNSQFYLEICRQIDYELGETYSAMVDCKYEALGNTSTPTQHQNSKINHLASNSIYHFQKYLDSFISSGGEKPKRYPEDSERPVLVAYFHIGRLWSKLISASVDEKLVHVSKSMESYKFMVDYCDTFPDSASLMTLELPVCREMVQLLPYKMQKIRNQL